MKWVEATVSPFCHGGAAFPRLTAQIQRRDTSEENQGEYSFEEGKEPVCCSSECIPIKGE